MLSPSPCSELVLSTFGKFSINFVRGINFREGVVKRPWIIDSSLLSSLVEALNGVKERAKISE